MVRSRTDVLLKDWNTENFEALQAQIDIRDHLAAAPLRYIRSCDIASQDPSEITAAIQATNDDFMSLFQTDRPAMPVMAHLIPGSYALNGEMQSADFANKLWNNPGGSCTHFLYQMTGCIFQTKNWPSAVAVRDSGLYAARSITDPVPMCMFRWQAGPNMGAIGPHILGSPMFRGDLALTDPMGIIACGVNGGLFKNVRYRRILNTGLFLEGCNNTDFYSDAPQYAGWQPTEAGGNGFIASGTTFSTTAGVGTTDIAASASTWLSDDCIGRVFVVQGVGVNGSSFAAEITARADATHITVDRQCSFDLTGRKGSFLMLHGDTTADSATVNLKTPLTVDLTGRPVSIWGAGSKLHPHLDIITTRVIAHDVGSTGKVLTLATQARNTKGNARVAVAPAVYIGKSDDFVDGDGVARPTRNNDLQFFGTQTEAFAVAAAPGAIMAILQDLADVKFIGCKWHGELQSTQNFASGSMLRWLDHCKGVDVSPIFSFNSKDPEMAQNCFCGEYTYWRIVAEEISGELHDTAALFYLDPQEAGNEKTKVEFDGHLDFESAAWGLPNQALVRYGTNGEPSQIKGRLTRKDATGYEAVGLFTPIRKTNTQTVNNSATLVDDSVLKIPIGKNEVLRFAFTIFYNSNTTADFKFTFVGPSGATGRIAVGARTLTDGSIGGGGAFALAGAVTCGGLGFEASIVGTVTIANGTTPGNVQLQWAQNTADASNTTVLANSNLSAIERVE